jgi:hypothetical protein
MTLHEILARMNPPHPTSGSRPARLRTRLLCTRSGEVTGKPCAGNPHARFERGPQETGQVRHRA